MVWSYSCHVIECLLYVRTLAVVNLPTLLATRYVSLLLLM